MEISNTQLQKRIMRRVWAVYILKRVLSPVAVQSYILAFLVWQVADLVHVRSVFANAPSAGDLSGLLNFYLASFVNTEGIVQALFIAGALMSIWLARTLAHLNTPRRAAM